MDLIQYLIEFLLLLEMILLRMKILTFLRYLLILFYWTAPKSTHESVIEDTEETLLGIISNKMISIYSTTIMADQNGFLVIANCLYKVALNILAASIISSSTSQVRLYNGPMSSARMSIWNCPSPLFESYESWVYPRWKGAWIEYIE